MRYRKLVFVLAFLPVLGMAQKPAASPSPREKGQGDEVTRAVLLANRPKDMPAADWLHLMADPVNRSLYPLRITQGMLDTLDVKMLDPGYQYITAPAAEQKGK